MKEKCVHPLTEDDNRRGKMNLPRKSVPELYIYHQESEKVGAHKAEPPEMDGGFKQGLINLKFTKKANCFKERGLASHGLLTNNP